MVHRVTVSTATDGGSAAIGVSRPAGPTMPIAARNGSRHTSRAQRAPHSRPTAFTCGAVDASGPVAGGGAASDNDESPPMSTFEA